MEFFRNYNWCAQPDIKSIQIKPLAVVRADDTVLRTILKIEKTRDPRVLVVDPRSKKLIGIVSPIDFVRLSIIGCRILIILFYF